jgi:hypothetical protein
VKIKMEKHEGGWEKQRDNILEAGREICGQTKKRGSGDSVEGNEEGKGNRTVRITKRSVECRRGGRTNRFGKYQE